MDALAELLADVTSADPLAVADLDAWWALHRSLAGGRSFDGAVRVAARVDRLGWVFASGYTAALHALAPELADQRVALAVTEAGGNHPGAVATRVEGDRLVGTKTFVTLGEHVDVVLVLAVAGEAEGRKELAVYRVPADRPGVAFRARPPLPFAPEIPHAELTLDARVSPSDRLPGDGWSDWVRPFRTVEDLHVHGALLAWLLAVGLRHRWPAGELEAVASAFVGCRALAGADPSSPQVHVAVGGLFAEVTRLVERIEPHLAETELGSAFARDKGLLSIASGARRKRLARAWERLGRA